MQATEEGALGKIRKVQSKADQAQGLVSNPKGPLEDAVKEKFAKTAK